MIPRADFIAAVMRCVGTQVGHRGRTIDGALDCVGVPWAACRAVGLDVPDTQDYGIFPGGDELATGLRGYCTATDDRDAAHIYQVLAGRQARHVVVPVGVDEHGRHMVVHAWGKQRRVELTPLAHTIVTMWRIRGVE